MPCTTVTNFCSEGKVMLLLSMVRYQVLLCYRHTRHGPYCYKQAMYSSGQNKVPTTELKSHLIVVQMSFDSRLIVVL